MGVLTKDLNFDFSINVKKKMKGQKTIIIVFVVFIIGTVGFFVFRNIAGEDFHIHTFEKEVEWAGFVFDEHHSGDVKLIDKGYIVRKEGDMHAQLAEIDMSKVKSIRFDADVVARNGGEIRFSFRDKSGNDLGIATLVEPDSFMNIEIIEDEIFFKSDVWDFGKLNPSVLNEKDFWEMCIYGEDKTGKGYASIEFHNIEIEYK